MKPAPPESIAARARELVDQRGISFREALAVLGSHGAAARRSRRTRSLAFAGAQARRWGRDNDASL